MAKKHKFLISFKISVGEHEFHEYVLHEYVLEKDGWTKTDEDLIKEVYGLDELVSICTEGEQPYWLVNTDHGVAVKDMRLINRKEAETLQTLGVLA